MKSLLRAALINSFSLYVLSQILSGVRVSGGLSTYILAGVVLAVIYKILKPVLNIISLPLNIITLGATSFLINIALFYIATSIIPGISITAFTLNGFSFAGFVIPTMHLNTFFAYAAAALAQSVLVSFISWLRK
ncbi:MAG TPA: phage holin family protein [Patescibacteria group bacterium]|nr:phage holin family protein [Patescibacteria group bacterium]